MTSPISGIHHVTAIAGDPQTNVDFYAGVLGLRLVKKTVNFDDPSTYHLYYGDGLGSPGTLMTFFPWPGARRGSLGSGQTRTTAFAVPEDSLDFWRRRFDGAGIRVDDIERFGVEGLAFSDPDGLRLELLASVKPDDDRRPWAGSSTPADHAIHGLDGVTFLHADSTASQRLLVEVMGFRQIAVDGDRARYASGTGGSGTFVDLVRDPSAAPGRVAGGSVHHVAFRVEDDPAQAAWMDRLFAAGHPTTDVKDRQYFHSIYFREPGGVLFELATDNPGFAVDEPVEALGRGLQLPPWLEPSRSRIERLLPDLDVSREREAGEAA